MQNAAMASDAADSYTWVGCTGRLQSFALGRRCALNCSSLAALLHGNDMAQGSSQVSPKQQPAMRQPIRPKASPSGTAKPAMSAAFQNGNLSRLSRNHAAPPAPMNPP